MKELIRKALSKVNISCLFWPLVCEFSSYTVVNKEIIQVFLCLNIYFTFICEACER